MKELDNLNYNELVDTAVYIELYPHLAAKRLWPKEPARVKYTRKVKNYCWNKATALSKDCTNRQKYIGIAASIWCELPDVFHIINIDLIPRREPQK